MKIKKFMTVAMALTLLASNNVSAAVVYDKTTTEPAVQAEPNSTLPPKEELQPGDMVREQKTDEIPATDVDNPEITPISENAEVTPIADDSSKTILTLNSKSATVKGEATELLTAPKVVNGTTLLPLRFVGEKVAGATVNWDSATKKVTLIKDGTKVEVAIGSKTVVNNGVASEILAAPIIENGVTLVPLRFISESMGLTVDFDSTTKKITITSPAENVVVPNNNAPVASFTFDKPSYTAGQQVRPIDTSTDPDGDAIIDREWSILNITTGETSKAKDLTNVFSKPKAGTYTIGLRVRDSKKTWGEWTYQDLVIEPNKIPVVTELKPMKSEYNQGEDLQFAYTVDNEDWEYVKEAKWTYRKQGEAANKATLGKPDKIFTEGDYTVTLWVEDDYGQRSEGFETTVHIGSKSDLTELKYRFNQGKIGAWIDNFGEQNYLNFENVANVTGTKEAGTLIMSDSPEEVTGQGILYSDVINGKGRLLVHHINEVTNNTEEQKLMFIVSNPTDKDVTITLKNKAIKGPAPDILRVGQVCLSDYLSGKGSTETITLKPNENKVFYSQKWSQSGCISAHVDVETTGGAKFTIANMNMSATVSDALHAQVFPSDNTHPAGTFDTIAFDANLVLDGTKEEKIQLGTREANEWVSGIDIRNNAVVHNVGNFGVSYRLKVTATEDTGVILNNRGGMFQGAVKWNNEVYNMPGQGTFIGSNNKAVVLGVIKKGETVTIEYILPNGSASPTLIGFIPQSKW